MKNSITAILLLALVICSCDSNKDDDVPPPSLPPTVYGRLPTRSDIIQTAEAVGATNVQIISYQIATGTATNITGGVTTDGGIQPSWWREDRQWAGGGYVPTLAGVYVLYDETGKMHPDWSVGYAIYTLFENAGFKDAVWGPSCPVKVETTTDNRWRLIPLPTHADIINTIEQLGAGNVKINYYYVFAADCHFWRPPPITPSGSPYTLYYYHNVPADRSFSALQGNVGHTNPREIGLSYNHPGLGSIVTNNDVVNAIRELFRQYGFESIGVSATSTQISAGFPLPSFNQIRQAAEQVGVSNVQVSTYRANNANVIPMNEGSRLADIPIIVEINYDGPAISAVTTNVMALFANFRNVHIGNNATAAIPLPTGSEIRRACWGVLYFPASIVNEPSVYTANGVTIDDFSPGSAVWNARIRIVVNGDGTNTAADAANAVQAIIRLFNERGFFDLDIYVSNR